MWLHPFAYIADGSRMIVAEGAALLVYDAEEAPAWQRALAEEIAFVGAAAERIVVALESGRIIFFDLDGQETSAFELGATPRAFAMSSRGEVAVATSSEIVIVGGAGERRRIEGGAKALAWDGEGKRIALARLGGELFVLGEDGVPAGDVKAPSAVHAIAWRASSSGGETSAGEWIVLTPRGLARLSPDASELVWLAGADVERGDLSVTRDGALIAARLDDRRVALFAGADGEPLGVISCIERVLGRVAFGPDGWLGVGLDLGDANKIELATGQARRTDPHEGRPRNRWLLLVKLEEERIAASLARAGGGEQAPRASDDTRVPIFLAVAAALFVAAFGLLVR